MYEFVRGSDVERDGMFIELDRITDAGRSTLCEVFYSDADGSLAFTCYTDQPLPLEHVEELLRRARESLPPRF